MITHHPLTEGQLCPLSDLSVLSGLENVAEHPTLPQAGSPIEGESLARLSSQPGAQNRCSILPNSFTASGSQPCEAEGKGASFEAPSSERGEMIPTATQESVSGQRQEECSCGRQGSRAGRSPSGAFSDARERTSNRLRAAGGGMKERDIFAF